jgi:glycosyltransferase involved in cell wall biosynthesis
MKRLLIISTNFPPSVSIGTQRITRICKYLNASQWSISVLTLKEKYYPVSENKVDNAKPEFMEKLRVYRTEKLDLVFFLLNLRENIRTKLGKKTRSNSFQSASEDDGSRKPRKNTTPVQPEKGLWQIFKDFFTDILQFPDKHITWLPLAVWKGLEIIRRDKVDVIFSSTPSHSLHLISTILKILSGKKLVIDFRDPWARDPWRNEERVDNAYERWKHRRVTQMEKWVVTKADEVILVTRAMRNDYVRSYPQLPAHKFNYFPNGYDPENVLSSAAVSSNGSRPSKVIFIHAGSLYKFRDPTPILYAVKNLIESGAIERDKVAFQFIGAITPHLENIPALAAELKVDEAVQFLPAVSYRKVMELMAESHVLILLQPLTRLQLPGKFFDYLCLGKPILAVAEKDSATENMVKDGYGIFADFNDVKDVEKAILFLYNHPYYNIDFIREHRNVFDMSRSIENFMAILDT